MLETLEEAKRQFTLCNGCRYCEGFCAVWDAMERRNAFEISDVRYLANLCHDCRDCFYACPYTPPHEYKMNIPQLLSSIRHETYAEYIWPKSLSIFMRSPIGATMLLEFASILLMLLLVSSVKGFSTLFTSNPSFYDVIPEGYIDTVGLSVGGFILAVWLVQLSTFWRDIHGSTRPLPSIKALIGALGDALGHKWFRGGGAGCDYPSENGSYARFSLHLIVFLGLSATFISTIIAAIYERLLLVQPPYSLTSPPVLFGTVGGASILLGSGAFVYLKNNSDKNLITKEMLRLDYSFLTTLSLAAITGLLTLVLRQTQLMGFAFALHMGSVLALFIVAPYSKFVHFIYRYAALVENHMESVQI